MYIKSNKRKLQARKTRQAIYNAASKLFSEKSFDNVTVEEIAESAGVSIGAFYHHFKGKEKIFIEFYENLDKHYLEYQKDILLATDYIDQSATKKLTDFLSYAVELSTQPGLEYLKIFYSYMIRNIPLSESMISNDRSYFHIVREIIKEGVKRGEFLENIDTEQILHDLTIIARGCLVDWCINKGTDNIRALCAELVKNYLKGICHQNSDNNELAFSPS